jgi:hypothetical protein
MFTFLVEVTYLVFRLILRCLYPDPHQNIDEFVAEMVHDSREMMHEMMETAHHVEEKQEDSHTQTSH